MSKSPHTCPTCGHPVPVDQLAASLVGKQRKLYEIVAAAGARGISSMEIMSVLYADDPAGGPESPNIICVMVSKVNRHLERHGLAIKGRSGHGRLYRLVALATTDDNSGNGREAYTRRRLHYGYDD